MLVPVALAALAGLLQWVVHRMRAEAARKAAAGLVPGTVVSVTRRSGTAFGDRARWNAVVVEYVDDEGRSQVVTQDAPGSGWWTPQVGAVVHLYRAAVWPGRVYRDRMSDRVGELIAECDGQMATHLQWLVHALAAVAAVWVLVELVLR